MIYNIPVDDRRKKWKNKLPKFENIGDAYEIVSFEDNKFQKEVEIRIKIIEMCETKKVALSSE